MSVLDILPLCYYGDPSLAVTCRNIPEVTPEIRLLASRMVKTMEAHDGIGLAASQVGYDINIIVIDIPVTKGKGIDAPPPMTVGESLLLPQMPVTLVNPVLSNRSDEASTYTEGCLSIPGITADVDRPVFVHLDATLLSGAKISCRCGGLLARCLQHEVDHLHGELFLRLVARKVLKSLDADLKKLRKKTNAALQKSA